jgi:hypothetical protein
VVDINRAITWVFEFVDRDPQLPRHFGGGTSKIAKIAQHAKKVKVYLKLLLVMLLGYFS